MNKEKLLFYGYILSFISALIGLFISIFYSPWWLFITFSIYAVYHITYIIFYQNFYLFPNKIIEIKIKSDKK